MARALHLGRYPLSATVAVPLAAILGFWLAYASGLLGPDAVTLLYPVVLPWYLGVAAATALRELAVPALGTGVGFWAVALFVMVLEAMVVGAVVEVVRAGVRGLRADRRDTA
ncbi:hypothetical protein [Halosegnis marinus]|uniref:Uncharacterized protein n=1 Tax=Halosegnis marinus TaxID=3034023 RepID=A0ABD5ZQ46_9EURY|nr:hypothetical protein [Halosegnis sp. DT85]